MDGPFFIIFFFLPLRGSSSTIRRAKIFPPDTRKSCRCGFPFFFFFFDSFRRRFLSRRLKLVVARRRPSLFTKYNIKGPCVCALYLPFLYRCMCLSPPFRAILSSVQQHNTPAQKTREQHKLSFASSLTAPSASPAIPTPTPFFFFLIFFCFFLLLGV